MNILSLIQKWFTKELFSNPWILYFTSISIAFIIVLIDDITILQFKDIYAPIRLALVLVIGGLILFIHRPWRHIRSPINGIPGSDIRWVFTLLTSLLIVFYIAIVSVYITRFHSSFQLYNDLCFSQWCDYLIGFNLGFLPQINKDGVFLLGSKEILIASLVGVATITALIMQYAQDVATLNRFGDAAGFFKALEGALVYLKEEKLFRDKYPINFQENDWDMMYMGVTPFPLHVSDGEESNKFIDKIIQYINTDVLKKITFVIKDDNENKVNYSKYITKWKDQINIVIENDLTLDINTPGKYYHETKDNVEKSVIDKSNYWKIQFQKGLEKLEEIHTLLDVKNSEFRFVAEKRVTESYIFVFPKEAIFGFMEHYPIMSDSERRYSARPLSILGYRTNDMNIVKVLRDRINQYFLAD